jgi:hypothetical protein
MGTRGHRSHNPKTRIGRAAQAVVESLEIRRLLSGVTIYVDQSATGTSTGADWADAYTNLQTALATAQADGPSATNPITIDVAQGTYSPGSAASNTFQLLSDVALYGGFASGGSATADPAAYPTVLSGGGTSYNVVTGSGTDATAVLDGFTIAGGNADGDGGSSSSYGGGIYTNPGEPTISNCTFTANFGIYGGAMFNRSTGSGGPAPTVVNCIFTGNSAGDPGGAAGGGAIFNATAFPAITDCAFIGNRSTNFGGAINNAFSSPTIVNCTFTDNSGSTGAAIVDAFEFGSTVTNCVLWGDSGSAEIVDYGGATGTTATYSDVQGGFSGVGNISADPMFIDAADGNVALQATSPCIDAGSTAAVPSGVTTDLAGHPRIVDGTVDMGAYEHPSAVDWTGDGDGINWRDPANWSNNAVPTQFDNVIR